MDDALKQLKCDMSALQRAYTDAGGKLNPHDTNHNSCPFCGDATGFFFGVAQNGVAGWRCYAGKSAHCAADPTKKFTGSIVDLVMRWQGVDSKAACKLVIERYGRVSGSGFRGPGAGSREPGAGTAATGAAAAVPEPGTRRPEPAPSAPAARPQRKQGKLYPTGVEAVAALEYVLGKDGGVLEEVYQYENLPKWEPVIEVCRFKKPNGKKDFRPIHRDGQGWRIGLGAWGSAGQLCPLFNLRALTQSPEDSTLDVVEGEKCARALKALGLLATTSQGGSGRPCETDWRPAARFKRVRIWQDVDADDPKTGVNCGVKYASTVAQQIESGATVSASQILIIDLRGYGLEDGQDVYDVVAEMQGEGCDASAVVAGLDAIALKFGRRVMRRVEITYPGQPKPMTPGADTGERPCIQNYEWRVEKDPQTGAETKKLLAQSIGSIRGQVIKVSAGWPCRVKAPGARVPLLFVDETGGENVRWISNGEQFAAWLHEQAKLKFNPKQDMEFVNFVRVTDVFHSFGGHTTVNEYVAVEARPHEPLMKGHYYAWRPPAGYVPDGRRLAELIKFFDNTFDRDLAAVDPELAASKSQIARGLIAASFLTPGWGGPYGKRPAFCVTAPDRGCGKSTLAWAIGKVWGGALSFDLSERSEAELTQRLLSPDALSKRVMLIDNAKGVLKSAKLEALITDEIINGKRMYTGDASRPNTLTILVTANGVRMSRDMAQRSFFIELARPSYRADWDKKLSEFITIHGDEIVADCIAILATAKACESLKISDRWSRWCEDVLVPACTHPALADVVEGADVGAILRANNVRRDDCDEDREEAEMFSNGLFSVLNMELKLAWKDDFNQWHFAVVDKDHFIAAEKMADYWEQIFGRKVNTKWLKHTLREHREAGRLVGIAEGKTRMANGYLVAKEALKEYAQSFRKADDDANGRAG